MDSGKKTQVFVRDATGLVKNVSFFDAIALNMSNMSLGAALGLIGFTTILLPTIAGVNIVYASVIGFLISVPQIVVYTMMTTRVPRTGGDYVWVSRVFGGLVGNTAALMGYTLGNIPYLSLVAISVVFAIGSVGVQQGVAGSLSLALPGGSGGSPVPQFLIAASIIVLLVALNVFRPHWGFRLVSVLMIIGFAATVLGIGTLLSAGRQGVENYVNNLGINGTTYQSVASSYTGSTFDLGATVTFVPFFAFFVYPWLNAGPAVASEIKGKRPTRWNVAISSFMVFVLLTGALATMYYVGGMPFINGALSNSNLVYNYSFNFWTLAMGVSGNSLVSWAIGIGWILWLAAILAYGIIVIGRYLLAHAFDRFFPAKVAYVSDKHHSPVVALLIEMVLAVAFVASASFLYGTVVSLYGVTVGNMAYFAIVGLAAATWGATREKGTARLVLVAAGGAMAAVFAALDYAFISQWAIYGGNYVAYGYEVAAVVFGVVVYFASKRYHMKRGIDISLAFKEIPPE